MEQDVYARGLVNAQSFAAKTAVVGTLVAILDVKAADRGLSLIIPLSRAVSRGDIHELIVTSEGEAGPGKTVGEVAYLGFFEIQEGGIMLVGDKVEINGQPIGTLVGYDLGHFPNHMNIVARAETTATGKERGLELGQTIRFSAIPAT